MHWHKAVLISLALEFPCAFTTRPFKPSNGAPPWLLTSKVFTSPFNAGLTISAPSLVLRLDISPSLMHPKNVSATPSKNLRITFPTKASHTKISAPPLAISLASTLPIKLIPSHSFNSGYVSFTSWFPFSSSVPIFTIPTVGFFFPITFSKYTVPIWANCTKCSGLASTLAPQSINSEKPFFDGKNGASAGLLIPFILPTTSWPPTRIAPVLPADTTASACPSCTSFMATTRDESFFSRIAFVGTSPISMISVAFTTSIFSLLYEYFCNSFSISSCFPTKSTFISGCSATASTAP